MSTDTLNLPRSPNLASMNPNRFRNVYSLHGASVLSTRTLREGVARRTNVLNKHAKNSIVPIELTQIKNFDPLHKNILRSGVIVYSYDPHSKEYYFYLGQDQRTGDVTDFGGGVKRKNTPITGGLLEFSQESFNAFAPRIEPEAIQNFYIAYNYSMAIMFIRIDVNFDQVKSRFCQSYNTAKRPELRDLVRYSRKDFLREVFNPKSRIYTVVQNFLLQLFMSHPNFLTLL